MAQSLRVDITKRTDTDRMVALAVSAFGGLDVAINNAGVMDGATTGGPHPSTLPATSICAARSM
jgi:NAD(P)-dependent dehydrogenase (short-subunit alcohol dehydrogenase family)